MNKTIICVIILLAACADQTQKTYWCRGVNDDRSRDVMTYEGTIAPLACDWRNSTMPERTMKQIEYAATEAGVKYMREHPEEKPVGDAKWTRNAYHAAASEWKRLCKSEDLGDYCSQGILP